MKTVRKSPALAFPQAVEAIAATLVDEYDPIALLTDVVEHIADVVGGAEVGIMVLDRDRRLRLIGSTSERLRLLELFELQQSAGPCPDAFEGGTEILDHSLAIPVDEWAGLVELAQSSGFRRASAFPLRARGEMIGAINVFMVADRTLTDDELSIIRTLANLATLTVAQDRSAMTVTQLQHALDSRVVIEQAKGVLAGRLGIEVEDAFDRLRSYSRCNNRRLTEVAGDVLDGEKLVELFTV